MRDAGVSQSLTTSAKRPSDPEDALSADGTLLEKRVGELTLTVDHSWGGTPRSSPG